MNRPRTENVILAITFMAGLAVAASIPSPYQQHTDYAARTVTADTSVEGSLPDHTVTDVDVRRLAHSGTIV